MRASWLKILSRSAACLADMRSTHRGVVHIAGKATKLGLLSDNRFGVDLVGSITGGEVAGIR